MTAKVPNSYLALSTPMSQGHEFVNSQFVRDSGWLLFIDLVLMLGPQGVQNSRCSSWASKCLGRWSCGKSNERKHCWHSRTRKKASHASQSLKRRRQQGLTWGTATGLV